MLQKVRNLREHVQRSPSHQAQRGEDWFPEASALDYCVVSFGHVMSCRIESLVCVPAIGNL